MWLRLHIGSVATFINTARYSAHLPILVLMTKCTRTFHEYHTSTPYYIFHYIINSFLVICIHDFQWWGLFLFSLLRKTYCILYLLALKDINIIKAFWFYWMPYLYSYSSTCACNRTRTRIPWANVVLVLGLVLIDSHGTRTRTRVQSCVLCPCLVEMHLKQNKHCWYHSLLLCCYLKLTRQNV